MIDISNNQFQAICCDGAQGLQQLPGQSIKLLYGSPPYPNATRDYGVWKSQEYISKISPFLDAALPRLRKDGFIVINVKANREKSRNGNCTTRSLVIERLAIMMEEYWGLYCVDIEIWVKENPVPTGLRSACQDAYEQNLWFSISPKWSINLDAIRRDYSTHSVRTYEEYEYKPRANGLTYVRKNKIIHPNPNGALPKNVISGGVSSKVGVHQAMQPLYVPVKYIKATTCENDLVVDPWMGSGTTGIAAISLKRRFIGFEVNNEYVKLATERIIHKTDIE